MLITWSVKLVGEVRFRPKSSGQGLENEASVIANFKVAWQGGILTDQRWPWWMMYRRCWISWWILISEGIRVVVSGTWKRNGRNLTWTLRLLESRQLPDSG